MWAMKTIKLSSKVLLAVAAALSACAVEAKVATATPFADNMVLQRGRAVPVWGTADAGETVTVSFAGQTKSATADAKGAWRVTLDPMPASKENRVLKVSGAANTEEIKNVLVGEVCSRADSPTWNVRSGDRVRATATGRAR